MYSETACQIGSRELKRQVCNFQSSDPNCYAESHSTEFNFATNKKDVSKKDVPWSALGIHCPVESSRPQSRKRCCSLRADCISEIDSRPLTWIASGRNLLGRS